MKKLLNLLIKNKLVLSIFLFLFVFKINIILSNKVGSAGCGIGSKVVKKNSKGNQLGASTLNAILTNSWSLSSGTSGCEQDSVSYFEKEQVIFVATNYNELKQEMAKGNGEKLDTFVALMGCSDANLSFKIMSKKKYNDLFKLSREESQKFIQLIKSNINENDDLSKNCKIKV